MVSDVECRLLIGKNHLTQPLFSWLENNQPSTIYIERTLRMKKFFVRTVKKFGASDASELLGRLGEAIGVLEGYVEHPSS